MNIVDTHIKSKISAVSKKKWWRFWCEIDKNKKFNDIGNMSFDEYGNLLDECK